MFSRERIRDRSAAVWGVAPDGTDVRRLTPWKLHAQLPHLSPATSGPTAGLIVFQSYGEGNPEGTSRDLVTVPADCASAGACRAAIAYVTHNGMGTGRASNPAWSPDGSHLVFAGRPSEDDVDCRSSAARRRDGQAHHLDLPVLRLPPRLGTRLRFVGRTEPMSGPTASLRVLIVDDHEGFLSAATALLTASGYDVVGGVPRPARTR